jgi:hypothetical protein
VLIATIIGFFTVFQARVNAPLRSVLYRVVFVLVFSAAVSLVLTLIDGSWLGRIDLPVAEAWGILALAVLASASFAEVSSYGLGRWAVLPTFLFFGILGNASSGGAVAPPLLPQPFASSLSGFPPERRSPRCVTLSTSAPISTRARSWSSRPGR